ncbi:hypothetical protein [Umezawaea tangerina]|uniref:Uncharacterized protein n=1 Tax=Umezawaea tangerina TaxID=84725 RepID=A0A2T0T6T3_9PSEU|nr:hypothetical protein [Umezawaea tangerina]PRY41358.1 hypothetical protein CLV43_105116 [Umezawaea tangerina]
MKRALVLVLVLLTGACGVRPSGVILGGPAPSAPPAVAVYLVLGGRVTPVPRPDSASGLTSLAGGPTAAEREQGYTTEVPAGVVFEASGGIVAVSVDVTALSATAVAQIVCTSSSGPVTLVGNGWSRGPLVCPLG